MLPKDLAKVVPKSHLMSETEWRSLWFQHDPKLHILLFKRPLSIYGQNNAVAGSTQLFVRKICHIKTYFLFKCSFF